MGRYTFDILKWGEESCELCRSVCLPREVFDRIEHLPFPVPSEDGHYKPSSDVFGSDTSEEFRPSQQYKLLTEIWECEDRWADQSAFEFFESIMAF